MSTPFSTLDLLAKYIRHDVPIYCHDHPTQPDGMNACVKEIESVLQAFELPDAAAEIDNPVAMGTLQLRDNAGAFELSGDAGSTWNPVGGGGVTWADMGQGLQNTIRLSAEWVAVGSTDDGCNFGYTEDGGNTWRSPLNSSHLTSDQYRHNGRMQLDIRPRLGAAIIEGENSTTFLMAAQAYSLGSAPQGSAITLIVQTAGAITITGATYRLGAAAGTTLSNDSVTVGDFCEMIYSDGTDSINGGWWILANRGSWAVG